MAETPLSHALHLEKLRKEYIEIEVEIETAESEKMRIFKTINAISERIKKIDSEVVELKDEEDNVNQLITEISKGFGKIEASTQSLLLLATRQLKMLKRKYNS